MSSAWALRQAALFSAHFCMRRACLLYTSPLNMAPTGIATFAKSDLATDIYHLNADVAVLGAPFDLAIQGRTGCRLGPRGIRLGSTRFTYKKGGTYDSERKQYYMDARR